MKVVKYECDSCSRLMEEDDVIKVRVLIKNKNKPNYKTNLHSCKSCVPDKMILNDLRKIYEDKYLFIIKEEDTKIANAHSVNDEENVREKTTDQTVEYVRSLLESRET